MGQYNFSIAPVIYHFMIFYMSFANLKNFDFLRLHLHSRFTQFGQIVDYASLLYNLKVDIPVYELLMDRYWIFRLAVPAGKTILAKLDIVINQV
jgi:hypothetical protein